MTIVLIILLWIVAGILVLAALLPFTKIPFGAVQGLSFPRAQFLGAALICGASFAVVYSGGVAAFGVAAMIGVAAIQTVYIIKFTPFWPCQSVAADQALLAEKDRHMRLLAANVKMSNRQYDRLIGLIGDKNPDVAMAIEVDGPWIDALKGALSTRFEHWIEVPLDTGYGLCVMSRLPLSEIEIRDLVTEGVPSIRARVTLPSGQDVRLYVVHPEPPVIDHDTLGRDGEIALVGMEAAKDPLPAIVTGDLNDVAWSTTTRRFQRLSNLLDPRVGRGFFNTFSATMPWMRWPLDHLFHDKRFRLVGMARMPKIGSDHFPMWFEVALANSDAFDADTGDADREEVAETEEMIDAEKKRDREPIGSDWENDEPSTS
ncbi:MAG: endonuclease/exonuclease/phosphatase family protein [Sulfitobacter sp.]